MTAYRVEIEKRLGRKRQEAPSSEPHLWPLVVPLIDDSGL